MDHNKLVEAMGNPDFYPHRPDSVKLLQTHISYIFVAGDTVYKVKKAVDFGFLDFTSLEKRKFYCHEELRLNRRLAPDVYLDVAEIRQDKTGTLFLSQGPDQRPAGGSGGKERIIEYAVRMKLLPADRMLKALLARGETEPAVMEAIARKVADFHRRAATGGTIDLMGGMEVIRRNHEENFSQTEKYVGTAIREYEYRFIKSFVYEFLENNTDLIAGRVRNHKIRECHGDLHLEHICITDGIIIFDCIEFNERFRYADVAAEVAFLAMDLDYNGYLEEGRRFVNAYIREADDPDISRLLNFYKCYYAYVRGKVTSFRTDDAAIHPDDREKARLTAAKYFEMACAYASRPEKPVLILTIGLMGAGKSALAKNLAPRIDADVIRTDVLRKEILNISPTDRHYEDFGKGIYAEDVSRKTYEKALALALAKLKNGISVIIDASYKRQDERIKAYEAAKGIGVDFFIAECVCREDVIKKRLDARASKREDASDGRWELYHAQKKDFDKITGFPPGTHLVVDTSSKQKTDTHDVIEHVRGLGRME
jgi:uncharacterized protein